MTNAPAVRAELIKGEASGDPRPFDTARFKRDMTAKLPTMAKEPSSPAEYWALAAPIEERYATEFSTNGVRRLKISDT